MIYVKVCGITNFEDAQLSQKYAADFLGFIFYKASHRYIEPKRARKIIARLKPGIFAVGVFVNEPKARVEQIARYCGINFLQLHGDEPPAYCDSLRRQGFKIIKALRIKNSLSLRFIQKYKYKVNALLFDAYSEKAFGGTGKVFDWGALPKDLDAPVFLSGGINVNNVKAAVKSVRPYAVDVCSSLEKFSGKKDPALLRQFLHLAKSTKSHPVGAQR